MAKRGRPPKYRPPENDGAEDTLLERTVQPMDSGIERINISLPVAPARDGVHVARQVNVRLNGAQARFFRRLYDGMDREGLVPRSQNMGLSAADIVSSMIDRAREAADSQ